MSRLESANPLQKDSLGGRAASGMVSENRVQYTNGSGKIFVVEVDSGAAEEQERNHFFGRQKANVAMMFPAFDIENNQGRGPLYLKLFG